MREYLNLEFVTIFRVFRISILCLGYYMFLVNISEDFLNTIYDL